MTPLLGSIFDEQLATSAGAVGVPGQGEHFGVMHTAVDHGCGHDIVGKRFSPTSNSSDIQRITSSTTIRRAWIVGGTKSVKSYVPAGIMNGPPSSTPSGPRALEARPVGPRPSQAVRSRMVPIWRQCERCW